VPVFDQSFYQVRLEWGIDGLARLEPADIVVVVDVLRFTTAAADAAARGEKLRLDHGGSVNGAPLAAAATGALVLAGSLRNAGAVARAILAEQQRLGGRVSIAVLPAGERAKDAADAIRFAIEDQLGAGAIIAALSDLGIDHISPEAAVACESFRALRGAVRHLLTASGSGLELIERGLRDEVVHAAEIDAVDAVPVLRDGAFEPA